MQDALLALYASEKVEQLHPLPLSITTDKIPLAFSKIFLLVDIHREERNHLAVVERVIIRVKISFTFPKIFYSILRKERLGSNGTVIIRNSFKIR